VPCSVVESHFVFDSARFGALAAAQDRLRDAFDSKYALRPSCLAEQIVDRATISDVFRSRMQVIFVLLCSCTHSYVQGTMGVIIAFAFVSNVINAEV
jgi:hypothetical protein